MSLLRRTDGFGGARGDADPGRANASAPAYDAVAVTLHWLVALAVIAQIGLGLWMTDVPKGGLGARAAWFNLHKSIGLSIGLVVVVRAAWRLLHPPPPLPASMPRWQVQAARASHALLYVCLFTMPVAGYLGSVFSGYPVLFFGMRLPSWGWKDNALKEFFSALHFATALTFVALIALHAAAALKHLVIDRDGVFHRMLPRRLRPRESPP